MTTRRATGKSSTKTTAKTSTKRSAKFAAKPAPRMTLDEAMCAVESTGSEQTRETYSRHDTKAPMFGASSRR